MIKKRTQHTLTCVHLKQIFTSQFLHLVFYRQHPKAQSDHLLYYLCVNFVLAYIQTHMRLPRIEKRENYRFSILLNFPDRITTISYWVCIVHVRVQQHHLTGKKHSVATTKYKCGKITKSWNERFIIDYYLSYLPYIFVCCHDAEFWWRLCTLRICFLMPNILFIYFVFRVFSLSTNAPSFAFASHAMYLVIYIVPKSIVTAQQIPIWNDSKLFSQNLHIKNHL